MKKRIPLYAVLIIVFFAIVITVQVTYLALWKTAFANRADEASSAEKGGGKTYSKIIDKLDAIYDLYDKYYIGDIDLEDLETGIMTGFIYGAGDKFGQYMDEDTFAEYMDEMDGETVGIGVMVIEDDSTGLILVVDIIPDSPAEKAGIQVGDLIYSIGGEDAGSMGYYKALDRMRGEEGSTAEFTVYRGGDLIDYSIVRARVESVSVSSHMYSDGITGVVRVTSFDEPTAHQFKEAMMSLKAQGAKRYVFDMRNNGGGLLDTVTEMLDYLVPQGTVIRIIDRDGNVETIGSDSSEVDAPMAVLVNGNTASAAELFTATLRDFGKSVTVGTNTYGKGTMQTIYPLGDGSAVRISFRMYSPPKTENYDGVGIAPDIVVEPDEEIRNISLYVITDEQDNQLRAAVEALDAASN